MAEDLPGERESKAERIICREAGGSHGNTICCWTQTVSVAAMFGPQDAGTFSCVAPKT